MYEPKVADMKKDFSGKRQMKLLSKQRILFRAFAVNTLLVLLIWALTFVPAVMYFGVWENPDRDYNCACDF